MIVGLKVLVFMLVGVDLKDVLFVDFVGKCKVLNIVLSLDILVCVIFMCKFNEVVVKLDNIVVFFIFVDLFFVVGCFCIIEGIVNVKLLLIFCDKGFK